MYSCIVIMTKIQFEVVLKVVYSGCVFCQETTNAMVKIITKSAIGRPQLGNQYVVVYNFVGSLY